MIISAGKFGNDEDSSKVSFRTAVPFWGKLFELSLSSLSPKRDRGSKRVKDVRRRPSGVPASIQFNCRHHHNDSIGGNTSFSSSSSSNSIALELSVAMTVACCCCVYRPRPFFAIILTGLLAPTSNVHTTAAGFDCSVF